MTTIIPSLRQEIETRLGELQAESDKLRNALGALKDNGAGKSGPQIWPTSGTFSETRISTPKSSKAPKQADSNVRLDFTKPTPKPRSEESEKKKPRKGVQAAVLAELERIAPERASAKGLADKLDLNRNVVSTTLSKLAKDNRIDAPTDTDKGYRARCIDLPTTA